MPNWVARTYLSTVPCGFCGLWRTVWVMDAWVPTDTFAARLALVRQHLGGWNVKKAATLCGIDDQSWRNWEAGKGAPRDYEVVCRRIADATGCDLRWLMAGGDLAIPMSRWITVCPGQGSFWPHLVAA